MADVLPPQSSMSAAGESSTPPIESSALSNTTAHISDSNTEASTSTPSTRQEQPQDQQRTSQLSHASEHSTAAPSTNLDYPAFASSLPYALVRDFAYPVYHPLHYGAEPEPSRPTTPTSDWNAERRRSDPMEPFNHIPSAHGGWSAGPWGGDGMMYDDHEPGESLASLPSTSFSGEAPLDFGDEEYAFKRGKHRKSKSYGNITDFERGRRRESGRRSRGDGGDGPIFYFQGQQQRTRGHSGVGSDTNGARRDSPFAQQTTLSNRSFHTSTTSDLHDDYDEDDQIPLDTEPHNNNSPQRDSMGPEDEELFAGPSLALYSFEPENSNELRLDEGQEIMVSYRHGQGWLVASDPLTGEQGLVPEAYVRLIADMPNYDPERGEFVDLDEFDDALRSEETTETADVAPDEDAEWDYRVEMQHQARFMSSIALDKANKRDGRRGDDLDGAEETTQDKETAAASGEAS